MTYIIHQILQLVMKFIKDHSFEEVSFSHSPAKKKKCWVLKNRYGLFKDLYKSKRGAKWDDNGITICGFRDEKDLEKGVWNDIIAICYINDMGQGIVEEFKGTTDPSAHHTKVIKEWKYCNKDSKNKKKHTSGAAHLCPGFYTAWKVGKHQNKYPALVQQAGKVKVLADMNTFDQKKWEKRFDYCGINIHYGVGKGNKIWGASAGCIVVKGLTAWKRFFSIIQTFEKKKPKRTYSFLLVDMKDYPRK